MSLDLIHFFNRENFFKIYFSFFTKFFSKFLVIFSKFFEITLDINFPNLFTISEKNLPISPKISSLFSKFNQKFFKITLKFLWLHKTVSKFSSGVLQIIFPKCTQTPNIFSKFSPNPDKMFVKTLIEILLNLIKTDI